MNNKEPHSYFTGRRIASMTPAEIDEEVEALRAAMRLVTVSCAIVIPLIVATGMLLYFLRP